MWETQQQWNFGKQHREQRYWFSNASGVRMYLERAAESVLKSHLREFSWNCCGRKDKVSCWTSTASPTPPLTGSSPEKKYYSNGTCRGKANILSSLFTGCPSHAPKVTSKPTWQGACQAQPPPQILSCRHGQDHCPAHPGMTNICCVHLTLWNPPVWEDSHGLTETRWETQTCLWICIANVHEKVPSAREHCRPRGAALCCLWPLRHWPSRDTCKITSKKRITTFSNGMCHLHLHQTRGMHHLLCLCSWLNAFVFHRQ